MKKEYHEDDRFEADQSQRKVKDRTGESRQNEYSTDIVYSSDVASVIDMFTKQLKDDQGRIEDKCDFYFACLDRIDILLTEKHSQVQKSQMLAILQQLAYFRPKKVQRETKVSEAYGEFTQS